MFSDVVPPSATQLRTETSAQRRTKQFLSRCTTVASSRYIHDSPTCIHIVRGPCVYVGIKRNTRIVEPGYRSVKR